MRIHRVVGKFLGVRSPEDLSEHYEEIDTIIKWARSRARINKMTNANREILECLIDKARTVEETDNRLNDLYSAITKDDDDYLQILEREYKKQMRLLNKGA